MDDEVVTGPTGEVPVITLDNYNDFNSAQLLAWLIAHGVDPYASTPLFRLRRYVHTLLQGGVPPVLNPAHPLLHEMSRPSTRLRLESSYLHRNDELHQLVQELTAARRSAGAVDDGLFSQAARLSWLPFHSVHRRADRLYEAGVKYLAPGEKPWGYAYSRDITGQRGVWENPSGEEEPAYVFRMRVRASMRQIEHTALVVVTKSRIMHVPYSECTCESGIDCSHEAVLVRCLYLLQCMPSYQAYVQKVLAFDAARAPAQRLRVLRVRPDHPAHDEPGLEGLASSGVERHEGGPARLSCLGLGY